MRTRMSGGVGALSGAIRSGRPDCESLTIGCALAHRDGLTILLARIWRSQRTMVRLACISHTRS